VLPTPRVVRAAGVTQLSSELVAKRLGLLHDLIPTATIIGLLVNPTDPRTSMGSPAKTAKALGLTIPPGVFSIADEVIE
jgi:hypothetical protein